jgi:hypothetical protein
MEVGTEDQTMEQASRGDRSKPALRTGGLLLDEEVVVERRPVPPREPRTSNPFEDGAEVAVTVTEERLAGG